MKKEDIIGLVIYSLIVAIVIVFGLTVLREHGPISGLGDFYILFVIIAMVSGVLLNAIFFEIAHIIGAKIARYNVYSVNVLGFNFYKKNGKIKFKFSGFEGMTGETKIVPKDNLTKPASPKPYLLAGSCFYIIELFILFSLFNIFKSSVDKALVNVGYFSLIVSVIGACIWLYNFLPLKLDTATDGFKLTKTVGKENTNVFNEMLKMEYAAYCGETYTPSETIVENKNINNTFAADIKLNQVYIALNDKDYSKAEELIDEILADDEKVSNKTYIRARAQKIFVHIMSGTLEEAKQFYDESVSLQERRDISNDVSMPCIRTYILMAGLLDLSRSETILAADRVVKAIKRTEKSQQKIETILFNEALKKVSEAHPSWELEQYYLSEQN